jgi:hypothetical protein
MPGLSADEFPMLTTIMVSADSQRFSADFPFEDLLDAYVRGLQARLGPRG